MAKAMKEISSGEQKREGEKWFTELSDKRKSLQFFALHIKFNGAFKSRSISSKVCY